MTRALPKLSDNIGSLLQRFAPLESMAADQVAEIDAASIKVITSNLRLMQKVAINIEQELNVYRLLDTGRVFAATTEQLATEAAATFILNSEGNVVRPDFGRKR
jgi:hypothetical protein